MPHEWTWIVTYNDGSQHSEAELGGWINLDVHRVTNFYVLHTHSDAHFSMPIRNGMRPIFFRRMRNLIDWENGTQELRVFATCFGWQKTINGSNVKSLTWLFPDGSIAVTDCDVDDLS